MNRLQRANKHGRN